MDQLARRRITAFTGALTILAGLVVLSLPGKWPEVPYLIGAAVLLCLAELTAVRAGIGNQGWSISLTETVIAAALFVEPGPWVVVFVAAGMLAALLLRSGKEPFKIAFNTAMHSAGAAVAALLAVAGHGSLFAVALAMAAYWAANIVIVSQAVSWASGKPIRKLLHGQFANSALAAASNTAMGLLAALLLPTHPAALLLLIPPVALLMRTYATLWRQNDAATLLETTVRAHEQARIATPFGVSSGILEVCRESLGIEAGTMLILENGVPSTAYRLVGDLGGTLEPVPDPVSCLSRWWAQGALSHGDPLSYGIAGDQAWLTLRLGPRSAPIGVVHMHRALASRGAVTRAEERLARDIITIGTRWASEISRGTADTQAGRDHLRELQVSAERLLDLSHTDRWHPETLVRELQQLERTVATLVTGRATRGPARGGRPSSGYGR